MYFSVEQEQAYLLALDLDAKREIGVKLVARGYFVPVRAEIFGVHVVCYLGGWPKTVTLVKR